MSLRPSTAPPIQDMPPPGGYKKVRRINLLSPLFGSASVVIGVSPPICLFDTLSHTLPLSHQFRSILLATSPNVVPRDGNSGLAPPPSSCTDITKSAKRINVASNKRCKSVRSNMHCYHLCKPRPIGNICNVNW